MRGGCALACLWLILIAPPALAQTVVLRSGEHEGFSRIVLDMPRRVPWQLTPVEGGRILRIEQAGLRFDTSAVYRKLTEARLSAIAPVDSGLRLSLACDCEVSGFWHGSRMLVIDVSDKPVASDELAPPSPLMDLPTASSATAVELTTQAVASQIKPPFADTPETGQPAPTVPASSLPAARDILALQMARAAGLGLVTASRTINTPAEPSGPETVHGDPPGRDPEPQQTMEWPAIDLQMTVENSVDQALSTGAAGTAWTSEGVTCVPDRFLDLANWGNPQPFGNQVGPLRARITREFDKTDPDTITELARLYLYFGFGAEARQVLSLLTAEQEGTGILRLMAAVFENEPVDPVLSAQTDCASDAALWSALSQPDLSPDTPIDADAMLRALDRLPLHLRKILAPQLARNLLAAGHRHEAKQVLRLLERAPEPPSPDALLLQVQTDPIGSDPEVADKLLSDIVETGGESAAGALVRRIEQRLANGRHISPEMADLAGAYAHEQRGTPLGADLERVHLQAIAASGDFNTAFSSLEKRATDLPADIQDRVLTTTLDYMTRNAEDVTFLAHSIRLHDAAPTRIDDDISNRIARRLIDLGFPTEASAYVRPAASGAQMRDRSLLRAEIALAAQQPHRALVELLGLTGEDADLLRSRAQGMAGRHRAAQTLYNETSHPGQTAGEALPRQDWESLLETEDPVLSDFAQTVLDEDSETSFEDELGILARDRLLLERSATARDAISGLLAGRPVPELTR